jgi:cobalt-zinc-cadmium efflux system outer membrane protein
MQDEARQEGRPLMIGRKLFITALIGPAVLLGGCASVERSPGFDDVQSLAAERGITRIHWNQGTGADDAVATSIRQMLADELTADEAVQIALLNNRSLQSVYEELRIAQADLVQAGLLKNPVFDGSIRFAESGGGEIVDLGIAFDFLDIFFIPMRKAVAEQQFEGSKLRVTGAVIDLAGATKTTFYELQAAAQMLEVRRTTLAAYEASFDFARRLRAAGNNTRLRVANEQAIYEEAKLAVVAAEEQVVALREELNGLMGLFGTAGEWKVADRLPDVPAEAFPSERLEATAIERSLDLKLSQSDVIVAAKQLGITKPLGLLSDLEVGATAERETDGEWSVGPSVALPIPIFSQGQPAVAKADAALRQAMNRHYATAVQVRTAVRTAYARMQSARERVIHYRDTVLPLRQFIVDETQKEYNAMLIGAFDLLQVKRDQVEAGRQYVEALRDYWIARSQLEQIAGGRLVQGGIKMPAAEPSATSNSSNGGH